MSEKLKIAARFTIAGLLGSSVLAACSQDERDCAKSTFTIEADQARVIVPTEGSDNEFTYILQRTGDNVTIAATLQRDRKYINLLAPRTETAVLNVTEINTYEFKNTDDSAEFSVTKPSTQNITSLELISSICES